MDVALSAQPTVHASLRGLAKVSGTHSRFQIESSLASSFISSHERSRSRLIPAVHSSNLWGKKANCLYQLPHFLNFFLPLCLSPHSWGMGLRMSVNFTGAVTQLVLLSRPSLGVVAFHLAVQTQCWMPPR